MLGDQGLQLDHSTSPYSARRPACAGWPAATMFSTTAMALLLRPCRRNRRTSRSRSLTVASGAAATSAPAPASSAAQSWMVGSSGLREAARLASIIVGGEMRQCEQAAVQEFLVRLHTRVAASVDDDDDRDKIMNHACRLLAQEFATTRH